MYIKVPQWRLFLLPVYTYGAATILENISPASFAAHVQTSRARHNTGFFRARTIMPLTG